MSEQGNKCNKCKTKLNMRKVRRGSHLSGAVFVQKRDVDICCYSTEHNEKKDNIRAVMNKRKTDLSDLKVNFNPQIHIRGLLIQSPNTGAVCLLR